MLAEARLIYLILYVRDLPTSRAFFEQALGFRVVEEDTASVKYSAGHVLLCLYRADAFGVQLQAGRDRSIDITFLVDDLQRMRTLLEARGVKFSQTLSYTVGKTVDFYDPDGHWFSLYEPSKVAMSWPSGEKIRKLRLSSDSNGAGANGRQAAVQASGGLGNGAGLDGHELVYLFLFVQDLDGTQAFYQDRLGLEAIEGGPCRRIATGAPVGVVKYDAGGAMLTTHHVEGDLAARYQVTTQGSGGVALLFHVQDIRTMVSKLARRGVEFSQSPTISEMGTYAKFEDPAGHVYYLNEFSAEVLRRPSGAEIKRILAAHL